jgi:hypothetical protein
MNVTDMAQFLASTVRVRPNSTRSVHIERDLHRNSIAEGYIFTVQARRWLERIIEQVYSPSPVRTWTLTGPYGSGKSLFGLFLMNLTSATAPAHKDTYKQLAQLDSALAHKIIDVGKLANTNGWLPVPITGYRAPLQICVQRGLRQALMSLKDFPAIQRFLNDEEMWTPSIDSRTLIAKIDILRQVLVEDELNFSGLLLIIDELGKPLEFAGAHPDQADIYLLQELAELANRSGGVPLLFIGILHQGFERYAGQLDSATQKEWAKIQGRFEDIAFQEPPNQQMWLVANALETADSESIMAQFPEVNDIATQASQDGWCPTMMKPADFLLLCQQAYPFHPTALVAMPYLFRRLAQNERSIFAFLTSLEPRGFQEFLATHKPPDMVRLPDLFDYLVVNFQGRLYATMRARALTEAIERIDATPALSGEAIAIVKTIALLNWLADGSQLAATEDKILFALDRGRYTDEQLRHALTELRRQSIVVYRRFNNTYAIWQGSDVDIDAQIEIAQQRLAGIFSLAQVVQEYLPPQPIVARRHSDQTGTVRFFDVRYLDALNREQVSLTPGQGANGLILLCLAATPVEDNAFVEWAQMPQFAEAHSVVVGIAQRTGRLRDLLHELRCLRWVKENTPELRDDPVARREVRTRLNALETAVRYELEVSLRLHRMGDAGSTRWFYCAKEMELSTGRGPSHLLSVVCDRLFQASPIIRNEILNRRQLSSQGAAARRNLIEAMLLHASKPALGIEGYPPERSMYESLLRAGGIHRENGENIGFRAPRLDSDQLRIIPVWKAISDFVFALPPQPRNIQHLFDLLRQPPYGLTDGVLPVLLCAFMIVHEDETTLYNEGTLLPAPEVADWEVLLRRPELFEVAGCRIIGPRLVVVERLARGLHTQPAAMPVVRELIRRIKTLPEHVLRTQRLTTISLAARKALDTARSPESLLFHDLPLALGIEPFGKSETVDRTHVEHFFSSLNAVLEELSNVMPRLLAEARDQLLLACGLSADEKGWQEFILLANELVHIVNQPTLLPLLRRAGDSTDARGALESTLAYVMNRPPRTWSDNDCAQFAAKAHVYGELFQRERNNHRAVTLMTPTQQAHSRRIVEVLRRSLQDDLSADALAVQIALQTLLEELQNSHNSIAKDGIISHD